jgi:hypothetical protein
LGILPAQAYEQLATAVVEVKRMLTGFAAHLTEQIKRAERE